MAAHHPPVLHPQKETKLCKTDYRCDSCHHLIRSASEDKKLYNDHKKIPGTKENADTQSALWLRKYFCFIRYIEKYLFWLK